MCMAALCHWLLKCISVWIVCIMLLIERLCIIVWVIIVSMLSSVSKWISYIDSRASRFAHDQIAIMTLLHYCSSYRTRCHIWINLIGWLTSTESRRIKFLTIAVRVMSKELLLLLVCLLVFITLVCLVLLILWVCNMLLNLRVIKSFWKNYLVITLILTLFVIFP